MKISFLIFFIVFCNSSFACTEKNVLFGEVIFGGKKPEVSFKEISTKWNVNSDEFDKLYLRSDKKPVDIKLIINKKVIKKEIKATKSKREGYFILSGINFQKDLSDGEFKFPFIMKIEFMNAKEKVCSQKVEFQVVL